VRNIVPVLSFILGFHGVSPPFFLARTVVLGKISVSPFLSVTMSCK